VTSSSVARKTLSHSAELKSPATRRDVEIMSVGVRVRFSDQVVSPSQGKRQILCSRTTTPTIHKIIISVSHRIAGDFNAPVVLESRRIFIRRIFICQSTRFGRNSPAKITFENALAAFSQSACCIQGPIQGQGLTYHIFGVAFVDTEKVNNFDCKNMTLQLHSAQNRLGLNCTFFVLTGTLQMPTLELTVA